MASVCVCVCALVSVRVCVRVSVVCVCVCVSVCVCVRNMLYLQADTFTALSGISSDKVNCSLVQLISQVCQSANQTAY